MSKATGNISMPAMSLNSVNLLGPACCQINNRLVALSSAFGATKQWSRVANLWRPYLQPKVLCMCTKAPTKGATRAQPGAGAYLGSELVGCVHLVVDVGGRYARVARLPAHTPCPSIITKISQRQCHKALVSRTNTARNHQIAAHWQCHSSRQWFPRQQHGSTQEPPHPSQVRKK